MRRIIDTHLHLWDLAQFSLPWLNNVPQLNRSFFWPDYLAAQPDDKNWAIEQAIYVEVDAAPRLRRQEEVLINDLCNDETNALAGGIIALDLATDGSVERWAHSGPSAVIKGVRHVLHVADSPRGACLQPAFIDNVRALGAGGWLFEGCVRCEELSDLAILARACPETSLVLNHMGNVDADIIAGTPLAARQRHYQTQWLNDIEQLAACNNVCCKVSGVNIADPEHVENMFPVLRHCLDAFGADKVMFGSNYPVCNLNIGIGAWVNTLIYFSASRSASFRDNLFFNNAKRIYQL